MHQKSEEKTNRVVKKYAKNKGMGVRIFNINYNSNTWIFEGKDYSSNLIIKGYFIISYHFFTYLPIITAKVIHQLI